MGLSKDEVQAIISLVPVAMQLTGQLVDLVYRLQADGYEVPSIAELQSLNEKLKNLNDLSTSGE